MEPAAPVVAVHQWRFGDHAAPASRHDQIRAAVAVDVVHSRVCGVVQGGAVRVALRRGGALIAHPGRRLVDKRHRSAAAEQARSRPIVDEGLNVATRVLNHVRQRIAVPLVHEQQVLEPVAVDVEMRQRPDRRVAVVERRMRQLDAFRVVGRYRRSPARC